MYDFTDPFDPRQQMEEKAREADPFAAEDPLNPSPLHPHSIDPLGANPQDPLSQSLQDPMSASPIEADLLNPDLSLISENFRDEPMVADPMGMNLEPAEPDAIFEAGEQFSGVVEESVEVEDAGLPERDVWDETEAKEIADLELEDGASDSQMDADDIWFQQETNSFIEPETPISERALPLPYYDDVAPKKAQPEESDEERSVKIKTHKPFDESAAIAREIQAKERACMENYHREVTMKNIRNIDKAIRTGDRGRASKLRLTAKARFDRAEGKSKRLGLFRYCINCGRRLKDGVCSHCDKQYRERQRL